MQRSSAILAWILVGALASAIGIGYFYYQANSDRIRLAEEVMTERQKVDQAKTTSETIAKEANDKLQQAASEIDRLNTYADQLKQEQQLKATASVLKPSATILRTWETSVALALGLSVQLPTGSVATSSESILEVKSKSGRTWLTVTPYDPDQNQDLISSLTNTSTIQYLVDDHLLLGIRGTLADTPGTIYVMRSQFNASSTHLLWAKTGDDIPERVLLQTLSTFRFRS